MNEDQLPQKAEAMAQPGRRKKGQTASTMAVLRNEGVRKADDDDKWREKVVGTEKLKWTTVGELQQYMNKPNPFITGTGGYAKTSLTLRFLFLVVTLNDKTCVVSLLLGFFG